MKTIYLMILLAVASFVMPMTVQAQETETFIAISSLEDLDHFVRNDLSGNYYLTNDIEIPEGTEWIPIGASSATDTDPLHFKGIFDGRGYSIKNLKITTESNFKGFFARLNHAIIRNLDLADVDIKGIAPVGAVSGAMFGESRIERVSVSGNIESPREVGGIVGRVSTDETYTEYNIIADCYVTANVTATAQSTDMNDPSCAGGIVGHSRGNTNGYYGKIDIQRVYVTGSIISTQESHISGNSAGILAFYDNHNYIKMDEVLVLSDVISAATPNLFFSRRGPTYTDFELFDNVYARTGITLNYLNPIDKGRGGEIPEELINYFPLETYKTRQFYDDNLSWDFENIWSITEGELPKLKKEEPDPVLSDDATLSSILLGDDVLEEFIADQTEYDVILSAATTTPPAVSATATDENANVDIVQATEVPGFATITVTAEDGETEKVYTINFVLATGTDLVSDKIVVSVVDNLLTISNHPAGVDVLVFDITGKLVSQTKEAKIILPAKGVFIVKINNQVFKVTH